jgi:hypothetical protein
MIYTEAPKLASHEEARCRTLVPVSAMARSCVCPGAPTGLSRRGEPIWGQGLKEPCRSPRRPHVHPKLAAMALAHVKSPDPEREERKRRARAELFRMLQEMARPEPPERCDYMTGPDDGRSAPGSIKRWQAILCVPRI